MNFNLNTPRKSKIPAHLRHDMALQSLKKEQPIKKIATEFGCSRTTVYEQRNVALQAVGQAFTTTDDDDKVMFHLPISKRTIYTIIILLHLTCRSTYRHVIEFLRYFLGVDVSIGSVSNVINGAAITASEINSREDLSSVKVASSDEVFHRNQPIMVTVDISSRYCLQADLSDSRDGESWAINLLFMKDQGYNPDSVIVDSAKGMTKGYEEALPDTKLQYDHFHVINNMNEVNRSLRNSAQSKLSLAVKLEGQLERAKGELRILKLTERYNDAIREFVLASKVSQQFATLNSWLQHDVLQLAGYDHETRSKLYDFILEELAAIVKACPQRSTKKILKSLRFQRDKLLDARWRMTPPIFVNFRQIEAILPQSPNFKRHYPEILH